MNSNHIKEAEYDSDYFNYTPVTRLAEKLNAAETSEETIEPTI